MLKNKIKKHLSITSARLNQEKELQRVSKYTNTTLKQTISALLAVKNADFTSEDRKAFLNCENYRTQLLSDETVISYEIFGSDETAMVKDICKKAASSKKWAEFFYFLAKKNSSSTILEIGTNLGISGCYALEGIKDNNEARFITMEGLSQLCEISAKQFATITPTSKFDIREGLFDITFPKLLKEDALFDLIFIDGNHNKEPTIAYFDALKAKTSSSAIFVFDDINWSEGMQEAWDIVKSDKTINFAIDLYKQGVVIIDKEEKAKNVEFKFHLAY